MRPNIKPLKTSATEFPVVWCLVSHLNYCYTSAQSVLWLQHQVINVKINTSQVHYSSISCVIFTVNMVFSSAACLQGSVHFKEIITVIRSL